MEHVLNTTMCYETVSSLHVKCLGVVHVSSNVATLRNYKPIFSILMNAT